MRSDYEQFIAVDWSGAKGPRLRGLKIAACAPGRGSPWLIDNPAGGRWRRSDLAEALREAVADSPSLIGFNFAFSLPWADRRAYFPDAAIAARHVRALWALIDDICEEADEFYGGPALNGRSEIAEFFLAGAHRGARYDGARLRSSEMACAERWGLAPLSVFKCAGPDAPGAGSLAGMRFLRALKLDLGASLSIWPFEAVRPGRSVAVEIRPRLYFARAKAPAEAWKRPERMNAALAHYDAEPLREGALAGSEREAGALVSAAALRSLYAQGGLELDQATPPETLLREGWIFGA